VIKNQFNYSDSENNPVAMYLLLPFCWYGIYLL